MKLLLCGFISSFILFSSINTIAEEPKKEDKKAEEPKKEEQKKEEGKKEEPKKNESEIKKESEKSLDIKQLLEELRSLEATATINATFKEQGKYFAHINTIEKMAKSVKLVVENSRK